MTTTGVPKVPAAAAEQLQLEEDALRRQLGGRVAVGR